MVEYMYVYVCVCVCVRARARVRVCVCVSKAVPLHAMVALGRRGGIAPTHY
jgi:hypothetical protein